MQPALPAEDHAEDGADGGLQDLEGELEERIFRRAVNKGTAEGVAGHHDHSADRNADPGRQLRAALPELVGKEGDHHGLQPVRDQRDKHGGRIKQKIPKEGADASHGKGFERIEQNGGKADHDIVQIEMAAGNRNAEGAERNIDRHQDGRGREADRGISSGIFLRHRAGPPLLLTGKKIQ